MEGGAFDINGSGSILLTEECLLSKIQQRNKNFNKKDYEKVFNEYLNIKNFIWLKKGIVGDDTHGHIDDITRFVSRNTIMTAVENNKKDKNYKNLKENLRILKKSKSEKGKKFKIITVPMNFPKDIIKPKKKVIVGFDPNLHTENQLKVLFKIKNIVDEVPMPSPIYIENTRVPASYMNFYICNKKIILPTFRVKEDNIAIKIFKNYFINKKIETVDCSKLIWGFGAIHCMTQQEPKI